MNSETLLLTTTVTAAFFVGTLFGVYVGALIGKAIKKFTPRHRQENVIGEEAANISTIKEFKACLH